MTTTLRPEWPPIPVPGECAPPGTSLFRPVIVPGRAVLVAGGPRALHVFQMFEGQRLWFSIDAHVWISGFAVSMDTLYVQDGVVLSAWDLTRGGSFAAVNLITHQRWVPPDQTPAPPPPSLHALPAASASLQSALAGARNVDAWAGLLDQTDQAIASYDDVAAYSMRVDLQEPLRQHLASIHVQEMRANARRAASGLIMSPPVVRQDEIRGVSTAALFVLALDGTLRSFDNAVNITGTVKLEPPCVEQLTLAEVPQPDGDVACHLYYVGADGGVHGVNASASPPRRLRGWLAHGAVDPARLLPLRYEDGLLWGGGVLGADFFGLPLDPESSPPAVESAPVVTATAPGAGWRDYEVMPSDQLVLVTDGTVSRLLSYAPHAIVRERWGEYAAPARSWTIPWPGTGGDAKPPAPRLALALDVNAPAEDTNVGFRVLLANTVDAADPQHPTTFPSPLPLDTGSLDHGHSDLLPTLAWLRAKPVILHQTLYSLVRSVTPARQIFALSARVEPSIWETQGEARVLRATDLTTRPLPPLPGSEALVAFNVADALKGVADAARAGVARLNVLAAPMRIAITWEFALVLSGNLAEPHREVMPGKNADVTLLLTPGGRLRGTADGDGVLLIDSRYAGAHATVDVSAPAHLPHLPMATVESRADGCTLTPGLTNAIRITTTATMTLTFPDSPATAP